MIQDIAAALLIIYGIGAVLFMFSALYFVFTHKRDPKVSLTVDIVSRIFVVIRAAVFWPLNIPHLLG